MAKVDEIIAAVKEMSVLELSELVKALEEEFGVSAAAPVATAAAPAAGEAEEPEEEKTEFDVVLSDVGDKKINVIKAVREVTGLGLKEAKEVVEELPSSIKEGVSQDEANEIKEKIEEAGATIEIK